MVPDVPGIHISSGRKDLLPILMLFLQETLQIEEILGDNLVFELRQPALIQRSNLQRQQIFLLRRELLDPFRLVELWQWRCCLCCWRRGRCGRREDGCRSDNCRRWGGLLRGVIANCSRRGRRDSRRGCTCSGGGGGWLCRAGR